jgi:hypothetical protein
MNSEGPPGTPKETASTKPAVTIQSLTPTSTGMVPEYPQALPSAPVIPPPQVNEAPLPVALEQTPFHAGPSALASKKRGLFSTYWQKIGAGSFLLSLAIHAGLLLVATVIVTTVVTGEKPVDFLPGGGSKSGQEASQALASKVQVKKRNMLNKSTPMQKIVSANNTAAISLPDMPADAIDMPTLSSTMGGGSMGSGGFGSSGAGGGFGTGQGIGGMKGVTFKPIVMFGKDLQARKIAVILDVSGSMTPHLTKVVKELDRVAAGSRVMLYVGCGVATPKDGMRLDKDAIKTSSKSKDDSKNFEIFWRRSHPPKTAAGAPPPDPQEVLKGPIQAEDVFSLMHTRSETYFFKSQGIQYSWMALVARELAEADALYWFSDFQDQVDDKQIETVLKTLKRRKQRLFMHASVKGNSYEQVRDKLVIPSGGEVIESEPEKKKPEPAK